jgi:hypothetical protein
VNLQIAAPRHPDVAAERAAAAAADAERSPQERVVSKLAALCGGVTYDLVSAVLFSILRNLLKPLLIL